jgi:Flp pilus assembly protein TadD
MAMGPFLLSRAIRPSTTHLFYIILPIFLFLSAHAQQSSSTGAIVGQVRIARVGFASKQMMVTIDRGGAQAGTVYTDGQGKFIFEDLPGNLYHITVKDEGYQPATISVALNPSVQHVMYVTIELTPVETAERNTVPGTIAGSNPAMVDESALLNNFPKDARKEYEKATKLRWEGKREEAIDHYEKALAIAPGMYFARNNLGALYLESQKFGDAEAEFRKVIAENQADANAYFNLANVCLLTKRLDEAQDFIRQGLTRQPSSALGHFLLGLVRLRQGNQTEAEHYLRKALSANPSLANAHLALVNLYMQQGRNYDAVAELTAFLKQSPNSNFTPQARQLLKKLQTQSKLPR